MLCNQCGSRESIEGTGYCERCKGYHKKYSIKRRASLSDAGMCIICGGKPAEDGVKTCSSCRSNANEKSRNDKVKLKQSGMCYRCRKNKCTSGTCCDECKPIVRKTARESQRRRIIERGELGLCSDCKRPVDNPSGMGRCLECHCKQLSKLKHLAGSNWVDLVEIWNYQHGRCALSGLNMLLNDSEVDHIVPVSSGGLNDKSNLRWVTKKANRMKGVMSDDELLMMCESICAKIGVKHGY